MSDAQPTEQPADQSTGQPMTYSEMFRKMFDFTCCSKSHFISSGGSSRVAPANSDSSVGGAESDNRLTATESRSVAGEALEGPSDPAELIVSESTASEPSSSANNDNPCSSYCEKLPEIERVEAEKKAMAVFFIDIPSTSSSRSDDIPLSASSSLAERNSRLPSLPRLITVQPWQQKKKAEKYKLKEIHETDNEYAEE